MSTTTGKNAEQTRFWDKISLVAEISSHCRAVTVLKQMYEEVLTMIQQIVPFDAVTLYLKDSSNDRLSEKITIGEKVEVIDQLSLAQGDGISGWTAQTKKPILFSDRTKKKSFDPDTDFGTVLSAPLLVENEIIGVMNLGCYRPNCFTDQHLKLISIISDQLAVSIERRIYEEKIKSKNIALKSAHEELKEAQGKIIEAEKLGAVIEISATINHEINNPLAVIIGNVQCMLLQAESLNQKMQSRLKRIETAALNISEVNRKLLNIDSLVSEEYLKHSDCKIVNLDKSSSTQKDRS